MPITAQLDTGVPGAPLPLEGDAETASSGRVSAATVGFTQTLGITGIERVQAALAGGPMVSHDDAVAKMKAQNYDSSGIPAGGIKQGALDVMMARQSDIAVNNSIVQRANLGGISRFLSSIVGGAADPTNVVFGVAGKAIAPLTEGAGILARGAVGVAEGSSVAGAQTYGQQAVGRDLGDQDQSSMDNLRMIILGGALGGGLHASFGGGKPVVRTPGAADMRDTVISQVQRAEDATGSGVITTDTGGLTKFGISAKAHPDVDIANLTQAKAAAILKSDYWDKIDGDHLPAAIQHTAMDAAVNQGVDKANLWLKESGGDPVKFNQLRADAYNGLAKANPEKYGKYLNGWLSRLENVANEPILASDQSPRVASSDQMAQNVDDLPPEVRNAAGETAVKQFLADDNVNVDQVINKSLEEHYGVKPDTDFDPTGGEDFRTSAGAIAADHEAEISRIETEAYSRADPRRLQGTDTDLSKAVPVPGRGLISREDQDRIAGVKAAVATGAEAPAIKGANAEAAAGPLTTEAKASMTDVVKEAEAFHENMNGPYVKDENLTPAQNAAAQAEHDAPLLAFQKEMAEHDEAIASHADFAKSVEAAVRCGATLGVE